MTGPREKEITYSRRTAAAPTGQPPTRPRTQAGRPAPPRCPPFARPWPWCGAPAPREGKTCRRTGTAVQKPQSGTEVAQAK